MRPNILETLLELVERLEAGYELQLEKVDSSFHAYFFPNNSGREIRFSTSVGRAHRLSDALHIAIKNLDMARHLEKTQLDDLTAVSDRMKTLTARSPKKRRAKK